MAGLNRVWSQFVDGDADLELPAYGGRIVARAWDPRWARPDMSEWDDDRDLSGSTVTTVIVLVVVVAVLVVGTTAVRRRGYQLGPRTIVRCRRGHLFTTIWIPGASIKAVRLGWARFQRCPLGRHWSLVVPVKESDLSADEVREAREHTDVRLP